MAHFLLFHLNAHINYHQANNVLNPPRPCWITMKEVQKRRLIMIIRAGLRWSRTLWRREGHHRYLCARSKRGIIGSFSRYLGMAMRQNSRCPKICDAHRIIINMYNRISHNKYSFLCSEYKVWNFVTHDHQSRVKQSCTWGPHYWGLPSVSMRNI